MWYPGFFFAPVEAVPANTSVIIGKNGGDYDLAGELTRDGDDIVIATPYAEAYIPESLFKETDSESAVATEYGEGFKVVGIFNMRFFKFDQEPRESAPLRTFNYPNPIVTYPDSSTIQKLELIPGRPDRYRILRYNLGDVLMSSEEVEAVGNCTKFLHMIIRAKIPGTMPYDKFIKVWENNFDVNSFNPGVPSVTLQMIWAELCRDPDDVTKPFRYKYGLGGASPTDYRLVNMNTVAAATSVFSGLSFERLGEKMASAINMTRSGVEQRRSPVEDVLTM